MARALTDEGMDAQYFAHPGRNLVTWARTVPELLRADLIYTIGSSARKFGPADVLSRAGKRIVMHWAGTDVLHALKDWKEGHVSMSLLQKVEHWAAAPWLVEELEPMGVEATARSLPMTIKTGTNLPLPDTFRVLIFLATEPHSAYNIAGTMAVVRALPEIPFVLVGGYRPSDAPPNLEVVGWVGDMRAQYARTSVFLRLVHHDAMSHSVIEALGYGRQVLWNYEIPGVTRVAGASEAITVLRELAARSDEKQLNTVGMESARAFRPELIIPAAADAMRSILA